MIGKPTELFFSIQKANYLLTRETLPGKGGDKRKFWQEIMGFRLPEQVRMAILSSVTVDILIFQRHSQHGDRYQAVSLVRDSFGGFRLVRTGWIVRPNETIARFITAFPQKD